MDLFHFISGFVVGLLLGVFFCWSVRRDRALPKISWFQGNGSCLLFSIFLAILLGGIFSVNDSFFAGYQLVFVDVISVFLFFAALYDLLFRLIPILLIIGGILIVGAGPIFLNFPVAVPDALWGAGIVGGVVGMIYMVTRGQGIGEADVFLGIIIGMLFGWEKGLLVFSFANFLGLLVMLPMMVVFGKKKTKHIPLVFFLVLAIFLEWYGEYTSIVLSFLRFPT